VTSPTNDMRWLLAAILFCATAGCQDSSKIAGSTAGAEKQVPPQTASKANRAVSDPVVQLEEGMVSQVKLEELQEQSISMLLTATGKVQFNEDRMARILAPVNGQVLQLNVKVGDVVHTGETLFFMKSREVAAAVTEHLESHKDLDLAEKTYAMTKDLFEHQAASRISLQQAESEVAKERAKVARDEEALRVLGMEVHESDSYGDMSSRIPMRTPLSGIVIERHVTEGQFVQPDSNPLLTIADLSSVWVLADIFERDLHRVHTGQRAEVRTDAYPEQRFTARVSRLSDMIDPSTRTVKVRFLVSNPGLRLKPEMFASVDLFLDESMRGLTVPAKAVFTEGGQNFVYVHMGDRKYARRQIEVVPDGSDRLRVSNGLKLGDKVVSDGTLLLRQEEKQRES
jgi:membrane fusion protein, heavy metal efflux system